MPLGIARAALETFKGLGGTRTPQIGSTLLRDKLTTQAVVGRAEASLRAPGRVFCAGSLAQCIRKWQRLPEIDQNSAYINLAKEFGGRMKLGHDDVVALAAHDDLRKI